jgi:outer membrane lipoprotein-sorting protein
MTRAALAVAILLMVTVSSPSQAAPSLRDVPGSALDGVSLPEFLKHAALARQIVDYEGTKVLSALRGSLMETVTLNESHKRPANTRLDFLSPRSVAGRVLIDDGTRTWHYEPRIHTVFVGPSIAGPDEPVASVPLDRYRSRILGTEDVIGRRTIVVSLWPQDGKRERRMWFDRYMGVALRAEERDPDEGLIATSYFTRISFGLNIPEALFVPRLPAGAKVISQPMTSGTLLQPDALARTVGFAIKAPATLPGGFTLAGGAPLRDGPITAAHLRYTDGVRTLALFLVPTNRLGPPGRGDTVPQLGPSARTVVVGVLRLLAWDADGTRYTLVGPLAMNEMLALTGAIAASGTGAR